MDGDDRLEVESVLGEGAGLVEADQLQLAAHVDARRRDAEDPLLLQAGLKAGV